MDAVSKVWRTVPPGSNELLINECDGIPWAFADTCVSQMPHLIQEVLFFFHSLVLGMSDMSNYVIPSNTIKIRRPRGEKRISDLLWQRVIEPPIQHNSDDSSEEMDINEVLLDRAYHNSNNGMVDVKIPPVRMHLAFTGALYKHEGEGDRKLICVLFVTPARNFDLHKYIYDKFLRPPPKTPSNQRIREETSILNNMWTRFFKHFPHFI